MSDNTYGWIMFAFGFIAGMCFTGILAILMIGHA